VVEKPRGAVSNICCNDDAPMVSSLDSLRQLAVACGLEIRLQRTFVVQYFHLVFKRNHKMRRVCARIYFTLYVYISNSTGKDVICLISKYFLL
jgi:hypothetical protein